MIKNRIRKCLPWLMLAVCYLFTVGVYALYGAHNMDSDVASEMVLADLLNREGALLSENWYYSTELRTVSPVPLYQLALRLFPGSWHAARVFSLAVLLAGVAAAVIYMARGARMEEGAVYAAAAVLVPLGEVHRFLFSHGGFYTVYVILGALLAGLVLRMGASWRRERLALLAVLGLWGGLAGVRMPMIAGVPLCMACLLAAGERAVKEKSLRALGHTAQGRMLLASGVMLAAMFAGFLVNSCVYAKVYHYEQHLDTALNMPSLALLVQQAGYLAGFFGGPEQLSMGISLSALVSLGMLAVTVVMAVSAATLLILRRSLRAGERAFVYFALCAVMLGMLVNVLMGKTDNPYAVGYYMLGAFSLAVLPFMAAKHLARVRAWLPGAAMALLCAAFLLKGVVFARNHIRTETSAHEEAAAWLLENGYDTGYASFWNGNVLTEAANGGVDMYVYSGWQDETLYPWLQKTAHGDALLEGPVFVFVSGEEYYGKHVPAAKEAHLAWTSERWGSRIYVYEDAAQVDALQRAQGN